MSVWLPKEHGVYGQIGFPLATAFGVAGLSMAGVLLAVAAIAGFLAHEPAAILLGLRGIRAKREFGAAAARWLPCWVAVGVAAGIGAAFALEPIARWSLAVPAVPALLLIVAMINGREKSWYGEAAAAVTFAGVSIPVALAGGMSIGSALGIAIPFALLFTTTTLAVRVVILRVKGGGDLRAVARTRLATLTVSAVSMVVLGALTVGNWLSSAVFIASGPGLLTATIVAMRPPSPSRLRSLGWSLVAVSTLTAVIVLVTARLR